MARPVALVFGARNTGRAVAAERLAAGWKVLAVSRTDDTLRELRRACPGVAVMAADAAEPHAVAAAVSRCRMELGGLDLVVNAVTDPPRDQAFGGGALADAPPGRLEEWTRGQLPAAFEVLRQSAAAMRQAGRGCIVQVAGPSARRPAAGRGPWSAAQMGVRALTLSLADELRGAGVHVALLIANGYIATERSPVAEEAEGRSLHPDDLAAAVAYLAGQSARGWTHELVVTPPLEAWTP